MYVEEEVFDCDNLYYCGICDRLVKVVKEEKSKLDVNLKDFQSEEEIDYLLMILKVILLEEENNLIFVDQLGQKFLKKIGMFWNKKYRKQYGLLWKFELI